MPVIYWFLSILKIYYKYILFWGVSVYEKYDIFISHKSQDKNQLTLLEEYLDNEGYSYWSDSKMKEGES